MGYDLNALRNVFSNINQSLEKYFPKDYVDIINKKLELLGGESFRIIAEPGSYYCNTANDDESENDKINVNENVKRILSSQGVESYDSIDQKKRISYYLNAGHFNTFMRVDSFFPIFIKSRFKNDSRKLYKSVLLWGPTCSSADLIQHECYIPECEVDDYMIFKNIGAYSMVLATAFNSIPAPKIVYVAFEMWSNYSTAFN
jgi:ornithine decarboxylase